MKRWQRACVFVALGIVCAGVSATIADARFGGPHMKDFLDIKPHDSVGSGTRWTWTWRFPGVTYIGLVNAEANPALYSMTISAGWPIRSFTANSSVNYDRTALIASPLRFMDVEPKFVVGRTRVYLKPSWGLAPNSAFYAVSIACGFRIFQALGTRGCNWIAARRRRRAAVAGRCARCSYPVASLLVCPECGSEVSQSPTS